MANFFKQFNLIEYDMNKDGTTIVSTDIIKRFKLLEKVRTRGYIYHLYNIKDGEKPFIISHKAYGRIDLDWLIMMTNLIFDPYYEWPLDYDQFQELLKLKYGSVENATQTTHHYERIFQSAEKTFDGNFVPEKIYWVDFQTYSDLADYERRLVTNYDYENAINEARREIRILDAQYIPQIEKELESIFE